MKTFNKVLAVILSLVMLLSVVPVAVFANESGANQTQTGNNSNDGSNVVATPAPKGDGSDGTITLNLDAKALAAALTGEKSVEALKELIKDAIDRSETDVITKADLLALVPVESIMKALTDNIDDATMSKVMSEVLGCLSED